TDADEILRALADPDRLVIAGALARRHRTAEDLSEELGLAVVYVQRHLSRLVAAEVARVDADRRTYRLDAETLKQAALEVGPPRDPGLALGAADEDEEAALRHYFVNGRLREIPARASKRRIVL